MPPLKSPHRPSGLTDRLADVRHIIPRVHRATIERDEALPDLHGLAEQAV